MRAIAYATDDKRFVACLPLVLVQEGVPGNSNDPHDSGGRTHEGVIQREYDPYRRRKGLPLQSVYLATDAEIDEIYFVSYWKMLAYRMPPGLDLSVMDNDVNEGVGEGARLLQHVIGAHVDGQWGPESDHNLDTMISAHGVAAIITSYAVARSTFYRSLYADRYFDKDWQRRTTEIRDASLKMVVA